MTPQLVGACFGVVALLATAGCSALPGVDSEGDDLPEAALGDVVTAGFSWQIQGHGSHVIVPGRRYNLIVSEPATRMAGLDPTEQDISSKVPDGARAIGVAWDLEPVDADGWRLVRDQDTTPIELTLTVDDEEFALGDMRDYEERTGAWVVVPEDADDVSLSVEYDGVTQTIEDPYSPVGTIPRHPIAGLYHEPPGAHREDCTAAEFTRRTEPGQWFGGDCTVGWSDPLPYVPGVGWAEAGSQWVAVRVYLRPGLYGHDGTPYVSYDDGLIADVRITVNGVKPTEVLPDVDDEQAGVQEDGTWVGIAVVAIEEYEDPDVTVRATHVSEPEDADQARAQGAPDPARLRTRWTS